MAMKQDRYLQGKFRAQNPKKYRGDVHHIVYRSSWELSAMMQFDHDASIIEWSSEEIVIPYKHPADNRTHRYFMDFMVKQRKGDKIRTFLIEIKPKAQTRQPKYNGKKTKSYTTQALTYVQNMAKWDAAKRLCEQNGWGFEIWTEDKNNPIVVI